MKEKKIETHEHEWIEFQDLDRHAAWYRKCKTCGAMAMTPSQDGFTFENGFDD